MIKPWLNIIDEKIKIFILKSYFLKKYNNNKQRILFLIKVILKLKLVKTKI